MADSRCGRLLVLALLALALPGWAPPEPAIWVRRMPWPVTTLAVSSDGVVLAGSHQGDLLEAAAAGTGAQLWRSDLPGALWSPPTFADDRAYLAPSARALVALRYQTGEQVWWQGPRFPPRPAPLPGLPEPARANRAPPAASPERVALVSLDGHLAILGSDGTPLRDVTLPLEAPDTFLARPALVEDVVYLATVGGRLWTVPVDRPHEAGVRVLQPAPLEVRTGLVATPSHVLAGSMEGTVVAVAHGPEAEGWSADLDPARRYHMSRSGQDLPAPVLDAAAERLYVGLLDRVACLEAATGEVHWVVRIPSGLLAPPALLGERWLVAAVEPGRLVVLERGTGSLAGGVALPGRPTAGPVVHGKVAVVGFADGSWGGYDLSGLTPAAPAAP